MQAILDCAGPRGRRNRDGAGLLTDVPYAKPPREIVHAPRVWTLPQIGDLYRAAVAMEFPQAFGFKPPAWWKALIAVAYNTALRRRALLSICFDDVLWDERALIVRPQYVKTGRGLLLPLNDVALAHLRNIRTDRQCVFEWPTIVVTFTLVSAGWPRRLVCRSKRPSACTRCGGRPRRCFTNTTRPRLRCCWVTAR